MKIPTYDVKPGSKAYSGLGERLMSAMGWSRCVARARSSWHRSGGGGVRPVDGARPNDDDDDGDGDGDERRGARARGTCDPLTDENRRDRSTTTRTEGKDSGRTDADAWTRWK